MSQNIDRNDQQSLSDDEMAQLLTLLGKVDGNKPLGTPLFNAISPLVVQSAVEAVCLRLNPEKKVEVYLIQRSLNDTAYPGEWHCPGSVMRPGEDFDDVFARLEEGEFIGKLSQKQFIANMNSPREARGHFLSVIYLCLLRGKTNLRGAWFPVDNLPNKTVNHHKEVIIPSTVGTFMAMNICKFL